MIKTQGGIILFIVSITDTSFYLNKCNLILPTAGRINKRCLEIFVHIVTVFEYRGQEVDFHIKKKLSKTCILKR